MDHGLVVEAFRFSLRRCFLRWFFDEAEFIKAPDEEEIRNAALDFCKKQTTTDTWCFPSYVPRFGAKELVFVHLFSGERRDSDIQMWMERSPAPSGSIYILLSVDVIYDNVAGDLANPKTQALWIN